jgi:2-dehydropantoate 2-reductase
VTQQGEAYDWDYAILGAGALGSIIAAQLGRAGHRVALIARGKRAAHLRQHGLRITGLADVETAAEVIEDVSRLASARVLIVATKAIATLAALDPLSHLAVESALSLQNGVRKDGDLVRVFGAERALGTVADFSGELTPSGDVLFTRDEGLFLGEIGGAVSDRVVRIVEEVNQAGIAAFAVDNVQTLEWSKFVAWAGLFTAAVLTRQASWKYLSDPDCATALMRSIREMHALAQAQGIVLNDRAILPVATLCAGSDQDAIARILAIGDHFRRNVPDHKMSALQDVEAGRTLELEETIGFALELAAAKGVAMPALHAVYPYLSAINRINAA